MGAELKRGAGGGGGSTLHPVVSRPRVLTLPPEASESQPWLAGGCALRPHATWTHARHWWAVGTCAAQQTTPSIGLHAPVAEHNDLVRSACTYDEIGSLTHECLIAITAFTADNIHWPFAGPCACTATDGTEAGTTAMWAENPNNDPNVATCVSLRPRNPAPDPCIARPYSRSACFLCAAIDVARLFFLPRHVGWHRYLLCRMPTRLPRPHRSPLRRMQHKGGSVLGDLQARLQIHGSDDGVRRRGASRSDGRGSLRGRLRPPSQLTTPCHVIWVELVHYRAITHPS